MKKNRKIIALFILSFLFIYFIGNSTIARYIYNGINNYILESKGFHFNSTVLSMNKSSYSINNWDGVNAYTLTIDVNNKKNDLVKTTSDIAYNISVNCDATVTCTLSKNTGIIYAAGNSDSYVITVTPVHNLYSGDSATVTTSVSSTSPYTKTMSAEYELGVENSQFSYSIEDSVGSKYLTLKLTNSIPYYEVLTAFDSYNVGDHVSIEAYSALTTIKKSYCFSAKITLTFSPTVLLLDMTDSTYLNKINGSLTTTTINTYTYITGYQYYISANSNDEIIFYKKDSTQNYTYPIVNSTSIVTVGVVTAQ